MVHKICMEDLIRIFQKVGQTKALVIYDPPLKRCSNQKVDFDRKFIKIYSVLVHQNEDCWLSILQATWDSFLVKKYCFQALRFFWMTDDYILIFVVPVTPKLAICSARNTRINCRWQNKTFGRGNNYPREALVQ